MEKKRDIESLPSALLFLTGVEEATDGCPNFFVVSSLAMTCRAVRDVRAERGGESTARTKRLGTNRPSS